MENNTCYVNNIKFKKSFQTDSDNTYKSKIYMKKRINGILTDELITDYEPLLTKYYRVVPIMHLYGLYIKIDDNTINVTQEIFLEEVILYKDETLNIKSKSVFQSSVNTNMLDDNDYEN
jgi:hypothetical protein